MPRDFPRIKSGDAIQPWHLNLIYDELRRWRKFSAAAPLTLSNVTGADAPSLSIAGKFQGVIVQTTTVVTPADGDEYGTGEGWLCADDYLGKLEPTAVKVRIKNLTTFQHAIGKLVICLPALGSYWLTVPQSCEDFS